MKISPNTREKAFRLRLDRRSFTEVAKEVGISAKTLARWEAGWIDVQGRKHAGWKADLERAWRENAEADLQFGLLIKEERLKAYEELARLAVNKIKEAFPRISAKTPADVKMLLSEIRELCRLIGRETGQVSANPHSVVAVKTDIQISDLRERYKAAEVVEGAATPAKEADEDSEDEQEEVAESESPDGGGR